MDFIVTSLIALGLAWVTVNILVGVAMFFFHHRLPILSVGWCRASRLR